MAEQIDMDDPLYDVSDRALVGVIAEVSREAATPGASAVSMMLLPQVFDARSARLARLTLASSGLSGVQWFVLVALMTACWWPWRWSITTVPAPRSWRCICARWRARRRSS